MSEPSPARRWPTWVWPAVRYIGVLGLIVLGLVLAETDRVRVRAAVMREACEIKDDLAGLRQAGNRSG